MSVVPINPALSSSSESELQDRQSASNHCSQDSNFKTVKRSNHCPQGPRENPKISNPNANVDIASGTLLNAVGFHKPEYYTTFFGWARVAGIAAQILDERNARGGRGTPIYRPKYYAADSTIRRLE